ncbi:TonB-dependent receptor [Balneolaceae bacterium ANBcel3]|nr:TonB-dependent receptor [Balneolaceae bacterium ANBcel3]
MSYIKNKKVLWVLILILSSILSPEDIMAENHIKGYVFDVDSHPLQGATIQIIGTDHGAVTREDGAFTLQRPEPGEWELLVRFIGYNQKIIEINIPEEQDTIFRIYLEADLFTWDEMLVTGRMHGQMARYQPIQRFNAVDIIQKNTTSLGTLLDGQPGVSMRSLGQAPARPVIRGMDGERIQMLQNGMRMGDVSSTAHDHAVIVDPSGVDQIDIIRGPSSLIYGSSAMGGVVNIHSGDIPTVWSEGVSGYGGMEGQTGMQSLAGSGRIAHGSEKKAFNLRGSYRNTGDMKTPNGSIPGTDVQAWHVSAGGAVRSNERVGGLSISFNHHEYGIPEDPFDENEEVHLSMSRLSAQAMMYQPVSTRLFSGAELKMGYHFYTHEEWETEWENNQIVEEDLELSVDQHFFQTDLLFRNRLSGRRTDGTTGFTFHYFNRKVGGDEALTPNASGWSLATFIVEEIELSDVVSVQGGVRFEWNVMEPLTNELFSQVEDRRSRGIVAASAGMSVQMTSSLGGGLQLSRAHRTPSVEELYADALHLAAGRYERGEPDLKDEKGYGADIFLQYETARGYMKVAGFVNRIHDYISIRPTGEREPVRGLPVMHYFGTDAILYGGEAEMRVQWIDDLYSSVHLDYVVGEERGTSREPLPYMPPLKGFFQTGYDTGKWWADIHLRWGLSQKRIAENEERTGGYMLTGMNAGVRLGNARFHHVALSMENIFDVTWRDHLSRIEQRDIPMMGRNIRLSYRYHF